MTAHSQIPCMLMRAGTSRGPFFLASDLPADEAHRNRVLVAAIGSADASQINGLGGGTSLTSKVAIVSKSTQPDCDVDYLFAQVSVDEARIDTRPNCGNMLAGVGPFAIERGLIEAQAGTTRVRIFNVNTQSRVHALISTPNGGVTYAGDTYIDGVAEPAAAVHLTFLDALGAVTGKVFPTGNRIDVIQGTPVTLIDAAMAMMLVRASDLPDFGLTGTESAAQLDAKPGLIARLESLRLQAGLMMGLGDVSDSVMPKPVIVACTGEPNSVYSRYFTPKKCHIAHAVTGAIGIATARLMSGTVASYAQADATLRVVNVKVLHPSGCIDIAALAQADAWGVTVSQASVVRTVRKIMDGALYVSGGDAS